MTTSNLPDYFAVVGDAGPRDLAQEGQTPFLVLSCVLLGPSTRHMKAVIWSLAALALLGALDLPQQGIRHREPQ
jgi:hypothetical protein